MAEVNAKGGISPPEACAIHRDRLKRRAADFDPNVRVRIERGCAVSAADYVEMVRERARLVRAMDARLGGLDALIMPTTAIVAPTIAEVADPSVFSARNSALLRNTSIGNFFDLCGVSLPLKAALPAGLMLLARNGQDRRLLRIAAAVQRLFDDVIGACRRGCGFLAFRHPWEDSAMNNTLTPNRRRLLNSAAAGAVAIAAPAIVRAQSGAAESRRAPAALGLRGRHRPGLPTWHRYRSGDPQIDGPAGTANHQRRHRVRASMWRARAPKR